MKKMIFPVLALSALIFAGCSMTDKKESGMMGEEKMKMEEY